MLRCRYGMWHVACHTVRCQPHTSAWRRGLARVGAPTADRAKRDASMNGTHQELERGASCCGRGEGGGVTDPRTPLARLDATSIRRPPRPIRAPGRPRGQPGAVAAAILLRHSASTSPSVLAPVAMASVRRSTPASDNRPSASAFPNTTSTLAAVSARPGLTSPLSPCASDAAGGTGGGGKAPPTGAPMPHVAVPGAGVPLAASLAALSWFTRAVRDAGTAPTASARFAPRRCRSLSMRSCASTSAWNREGRVVINLCGRRHRHSPGAPTPSAGVRSTVPPKSCSHAARTRDRLDGSERCTRPARDTRKARERTCASVARASSSSGPGGAGGASMHLAHTRRELEHGGQS
eukprot:scaffold5558_cov131-Isochrysis_galbana.AAC.6